jgi:cleavage and polyadenylation specificity factor subunit 2
MPCDSSTRVLELLVFFDQYWTNHKMNYPICLMSRTGREMLTFVRSMMEWLGGTISKEDVGVEERRRFNKRARDDDDDGDDALGAFALRFRYVSTAHKPT